DKENPSPDFYGHPERLGLRKRLQPRGSFHRSHRLFSCFPPHVRPHPPRCTCSRTQHLEHTDQLVCGSAKLSLTMRPAPPGVARRAQGPEPAGDISNSSIPHLHILSILCQDFIAFDHRDQKARSLLRNQVAADSSLMLSPSQSRGNAFL